MKCIEAINEYQPKDDEICVFLGGGITNCPLWQKELIELLKNEDIVIYNPRRKIFPFDDPNECNKQIEWEFKYLNTADVRVFWFSKGSFNPIVLFEYGKWLRHASINSNLNMSEFLFVGMDSEYIRRRDVEIQTELEYPEVAEKIVYNLENLANQIKEHLKKYNFK